MSLAIYIKDSCKNMSEIPNNSVDLILTSPPYWMLRNYKSQNQIGYGMTYKQFIYYLSYNIAECVRVLKEDALAIFIIADIRPKAGYGGKEEGSRCKTYPLQADIINVFQSFDCDLFSHIIWSKTSNKSDKIIHGNVDSEYAYPPYIHMDLSIEHVIVFRKPGQRRNTPSREECKANKDIIDKKTEVEELLKPVWNIEPVNSNSTDHPAPFPAELVTRLIRMFSLKGDTILDPFCGTGTTLKVASDLGRNGIGYDVSLDYVQEFITDFGLLQDETNDSFCFKI